MRALLRGLAGRVRLAWLLLAIAGTPRRRVPGLPDDGEPLSERELKVLRLLRLYFAVGDEADEPDRSPP